MADRDPYTISLYNFAVAKGYHKPKKLKRHRFCCGCKPQIIKSKPPTESLPRTKVYAAGCNSWHNLDLAEPTSPEKEYSSVPDDIEEFSVVLEGESISDLRAFLSWTACRINGEREIFGTAPYSLGLESLLKTTQNGKGEVVEVRPGYNTILLFPNLKACARRDFTSVLVRQPRACHAAEFRPITKIAAWETGFVMMDDEHMVYTMGDERYGQCLGREITKDRPANVPFLVDALLGPVGKTKKVVAGGYTVAALTFDGEIYAWGMASPGSSTHTQAIQGLNDMPSYQKVGNDEEIADLALGDSHAIALTKKGHLYVIGDNAQGQLGLGDDKRRDSWTKVDDNVARGYQVEEVVAGPQSSFLIVRLGENAGMRATRTAVKAVTTVKKTKIRKRTAGMKRKRGQTASKKEAVVKKTAPADEPKAGEKRAKEKSSGDSEEAPEVKRAKE